MGLKTIAALLATGVPLALAAQPTEPPATAAPVTPAQAGAQSPDAKKPYVPHKTPLAKKKAPDKAKATTAPRKPAPPKPPAPPPKPSNVPSALQDRKGNAIPTSPDAYDVSSATKK